MFSGFINRRAQHFVRLCHQQISSIVSSASTLNRSPYLPQQLCPSSSWCGPKSPASHLSGADLERLFIDKRVQQLLTRMTGKDEPKIHRARRIGRTERNHYALMTNAMHREYLGRLEQRSAAFLKFVPFKEPVAGGETLSEDPEIDGFDTANFVFTDIGHEATNLDRTVVVRQPDGKLRTAFAEERGRMNRLYYEQPDRPIKEPPIFSIDDQWLQAALDKDEHEFVLDWAVHFYEPDDPKFVEFCKHIFDKTLEANKLDVLHSTRHFGTLAFYLLINGKLPAFLKFYAQRKSVDGVANTIRLWRLLFPSWRPKVDIDHVDLKVVKDFVFSVFTQRQRPDRAETMTKEDIGPETIDGLLELVCSGKGKELFTTASATSSHKYHAALIDLDEEGYGELEARAEIRNLSPAEFRSPAFPATGWIFGANDRFMVCLPCCRVHKPIATVNVFFLLDTGCKITYLSSKTIGALFRNDECVSETSLRFSIGDPNSKIECSVSPIDHPNELAEVNILGVSALRELDLSIKIDWKCNEFMLIKNNM